MFKFLKRLRGKKEEAQPQPDAVATKAIPEPEVGAPVTPPAPATEVPASVTAKAPETEKEIEPQPTFDTAIEDVAEPAEEPEPTKEPEPKAEVVEVELPKRSLSDGIRSLFSSNVDIEDLEDILLLADFGVEASVEITESLRKAASKSGATSDAELRLLLKGLLVEKLHRDDLQLNLSDGKLPYVFLVVGVNGAGKTTTIGKLAKWLSDGEWEVVLGAADTFRAAAVDQLATWAVRSGAGIVRPERDGQDPASVAYQTVELAIKNDADIAIVDTAGRLQNKKDLMDELGKIRRAVEKQAQINEVLLVIDATTGQNAISQAKAFTEVAEVTGIVMTKLDGTAKGGIVYTIQQQLDLPVKLVGVGEGVNDFAFFSAEEFANGLVARKPGN
ncbi:signal recognition particle-docking protein FtsY [Aquiluna sp.]|nr:signal recognition particle-docking protein FtsY [Aquiluna sp.]